jgi:hypothetical protein
MPAPQTTVSIKPAAYFAGMLVDLNDYSSESYVNEEASIELAFGRMVKQGTAVEQAKELAAQADVPIGIVMHSHRYAKDDELGTTGLKPGVSLAVITRGKIVVEVGEAVGPNDAVRYNATGTGGTKGVFYKTASANNTKLVTSARWLSSTSGAGLAELEIDMSSRSTWTNDT